MSTTSERKPLQFYLDKAYPVVVYPAEEGGYVAEIEELPGCITQGETIDEVMEFIEDAKRAWMEVEYEEGADIPLPSSEETYSGRLLVRLPKYLHRRLAQQAVREETSLNQYIVSLLSGGLGARETLAGMADTGKAATMCAATPARAKASAITAPKRLKAPVSSERRR